MKSSYSISHDCINVQFPEGEGGEITTRSELIMFEDAMPRGEKRWGGFLTTPENFKAFIDGVKAGEFDHFVEGL